MNPEEKIKGQSLADVVAEPDPEHLGDAPGRFFCLPCDHAHGGQAAGLGRGQR